MHPENHDGLEDFILNHQDSFDDAQPPAGLWDRIDDALGTDDDDDHDDDGLDLEGFVRRHRLAFDDTTPPPRLAGRIFAALDVAETGNTATATPAPPLRAAHSRRRLFRIAGIAASFLLLLAAAFSLGTNRGYQAAEQDQLAAELERISPDFVETERFYQGEIHNVMEQVRTVNNDPQLVADLEEMNTAAADIRASLLEVPESQRPDLVEELIHIYRTKLEILLRIQRQLPAPATAPAATTQQKL